MKLRRSYKHYYKRLKVRHYRLRLYRYGKRLGPRQYASIWLAWVTVLGAYVAIGFVGTKLVARENKPDLPPAPISGFSSYAESLNLKFNGRSDMLRSLNKDGTESKSAPTTSAPAPTMITPNLTYKKTTATVFWVGEPAGPENDYIANDASAWDGSWKSHYGGFDNPSSRTANYFPVGFTPKENPFYFALPYNDLDASGHRKPTASLCPGSSSKINLKYSWCKNTWIAIKSGGKIAYAQWEDVGPNEEDDPGYVFGSSKPKNTFGEKAGLDISPAVRDFLGVGDSSSVEWTFIDASSVPSGPWKQVVTTSLGYQVN